MNVFVNGKNTDLPQEVKNIALLVRFLEIPTTGVAVAINNKVVRKTDWEVHMLAEGDEVMIITAVCGG